MVQAGLLQVREKYLLNFIELALLSQIEKQQISPLSMDTWICGLLSNMKLAEMDYQVSTFLTTFFTQKQLSAAVGHSGRWRLENQGLSTRQLGLKHYPHSVLTKFISSCVCTALLTRIKGKQKLWGGVERSCQARPTDESAISGVGAVRQLHGRQVGTAPELHPSDIRAENVTLFTLTEVRLLRLRILESFLS